MKLNEIPNELKLHVFRFLALSDWSDWSSLSLVCVNFNSFLDKAYRQSPIIKDDIEKYCSKYQSEYKQLAETEQKINRYNKQYYKKMLLYRLAEAICFFSASYAYSKLPAELNEVFSFDKPPAAFILTVVGGQLVSSFYTWRPISNLINLACADGSFETRKELAKREKTIEDFRRIRIYEKNKKEGKLRVLGNHPVNVESSQNEEKRFAWLI